jgi:hypothetical protein
MFNGFITPEKYVEVHDPTRWVIAGATPQEELVPAGVGASEGGGGGAGEAASDSGDERASEVGGLD